MKFLNDVYHSAVFRLILGFYFIATLLLGMCALFAWASQIPDFAVQMGYCAAISYGMATFLLLLLGIIVWIRESD